MRALSLFFLRLPVRVLLAVALLALALIVAPAARAQSLKTTVRAAIEATMTGAVDLGAQTFQITTPLPISLANGAGSGQANQIFADQRTLAASATENLDLAGVLVNPFGSTITFATVKAIRICAAAANTNNVNIGGAVSNAFVGPFLDATDKIAVKPGGCFLAVAPGTGWTVTPSTGDLLLVANSGAGTSVTYDVTIVGIQ